MILYELKCKDLGFDSCRFIAIGNSESELKRKFFLHTAFDHEKEFELMTDEQRIELNYLIKRILDDQN